MENTRETSYGVHYLDAAAVERFRQILQNLERSDATIDKYIRDVEAFRKWLGGQAGVDKAAVIAYKQALQAEYKVTSTNSKLSALNTFFRCMSWEECRVSTLKVQRATFRDPQRNLSKDEFESLLHAAEEKGRTRLCRIMETLAGTGIRISELPFITVESLSTRRAVVTLKGKTRTVLLPLGLCHKLRAWCRERGIKKGSIFVTRTGRPLDRSNILHMMKRLADAADVLRSKIFPHNLRHLFAVTFYAKEKDIVRLADLLGHSNINTTRIYTQITYEEQLLAVDGVGDELLLSA